MPRILPIQSPRVKPPFGSVIDPESPYSRDLKFLLPLNEGGGSTVRDLVTGSVATLNTGATWKGSAFGPALDFNNTATGNATFDSKAPTINAAANTVLVIFLARTTGGVAFGTLWAGGDSSAHSWGMFFNGSAVLDYNSNNLARATAATTSLNVWHVATMIPSSTSNLFTLDGKFQAFGSSAAGGAATSPLVIGYNASTGTWDGRLAFMAAWGHTKSDVERKFLTANPFTMLAAPTPLRRFWIFTPPSSTRILAGGATVDETASGTAIAKAILAGGATAEETATGTPTASNVPATVHYTAANLTLDTAAAVYGGSNLVTVNSAVQLALNRPAVDSHHQLYARLENGTGTTITDDSTNANTGTLTVSGDSPKWEMPYSTSTGLARFTTSGYYATTNPHIDIGNVLHYEYTQPWTVWAVVQGASGHAPAAGGAAIIFTNCQTGTAYRGWELWVDDTNHLRTRIIHDFTNNQYIDVHGGTAIVNGSWHTVCFTYDGSGTAAGVKLYVDGTLETMTTVSDTLGGLTIATASDHFYLGNQSGWPYSWPGVIGPMRIYTVAQNSTFASTYASSVPAASLANTAAAWDFTETSGTSVADSSGHSLTGTATTADVLAAFDMGSAALRYDGGGGYVDYPAITPYNLSSTFTLFAWATAFNAPNSGALWYKVDTGGSTPGWGLMTGYSGPDVQWWDGAAFRNFALTSSNGWHCWVIRFNAGVLDYWLDGTKVATITGTTPTTSTHDLLLGNWPTVAAWQGLISNHHLSDTNRSDAYIQQFSTAHPAAGIASLSSPSTAIASGGGDYGAVVSLTQLAATFSKPTTTVLQFRVGLSSVSAAAATTAKNAAGWTTLAATQAVSGTGRWLDYDVRFAPSTDTIARDTPVLTDITFSYTVPTVAVLAGGGTLDDTATGTLTAKAIVAGGATVEETATGTLVASVHLAGGATLDETATGRANAGKLLSGGATLDETAAGAVIARAILAGAASLEDTAAGALLAKTILAGGATLEQTGSGALLTRAILAGTASLEDTAAGALLAKALLAGSGSLDQTAAGAVLARALLAGAASVEETGSGTLRAIARLTGTASLDITGAGSIAGTLHLSGTATVEETGAGTLTTIVRLSGGATLDETATGSVGTIVPLQGTASIDLGGTGGLRRTVNLSGGASLEETAAGGLHFVVQLLGQATEQLTAGGGLVSTSVVVPLPGGPYQYAASAVTLYQVAQIAAVGTVTAYSVVTGMQIAVTTVPRAEE